MIDLELHAVGKAFNLRDGGSVVALAGVTTSFPAGSFTIVVGANGSGKTTLLDILAGTHQADNGKVVATLSGRSEDWTDRSARWRSRHVSRVRQDPAAGSVGDLSVAENIRLATLEGTPLPFRRATSRAWRADCAARLRGGALQGKAEAAADELSIGQRQTLALEMAAARHAPLLLMDEPTASLDGQNAARCMARAVALARESEATTILVTHDMVLASSLGDRLLVLRDGRVSHEIAYGNGIRPKPEDILKLCIGPSPGVPSG